MHTLLVCHPRTRSSFFCDSYSKFYNVENFHEFLDFGEPLNKTVLKGKLLNNLTDKLVMEKHLKHIQTCTDEIFSQKGGIVKFFPRHILNTHSEFIGYQYSIANIKNINFQYIPNFHDLLRIENYDQIIFLKRNLHDSTLSYVFNLFGLSSPLLTKEIHKEYLHKKYTNFTITQDYLKHINFFVYEYCLYNKIVAYLQTKYNGLELDYDTCVDYVHNNLSNDIKSRYLETNLNYKNFISNYDEITNYIDNTQKQIENEKFEFVKLK